MKHPKKFASAMFVVALAGGACGGSSTSSDQTPDAGIDSSSNVPPHDGAAPPPSDSGSHTDGPPVNSPDANPSTGTLTCGSDTCNASTQVCCITGLNQQSCVAQGTCTGATVACNGPANCQNGDKCCGAFVGGGSLEGIFVIGLIMFVVLMPFFALREIGAIVGSGKLFELFFIRRIAYAPQE